MSIIEDAMTCCTLCPRNCGINRQAGKIGVCGVPAEIYVARAALHFWEEPCISGKKGSGAVFFTGCGLKCVYCQNAPISGTSVGTVTESRAEEGQTPFDKNEEAGRKEGSAPRVQIPGRKVTVEHLAEIFLNLQDRQGANNINLVTGVQYIPQIAEALRMAKENGLTIPVVYNSSGYEKVSSLKMLEGLIDIWLPDLKYMEPEPARAYSHAPDYPEAARAAIAEMVRQTGPSEFWEKDGQRLMRRGVIVRHLLLPGHVRNAKAVISYLHRTYGDDIFISMMNQYTPMQGMAEDPLLSRKVTKREYERLIDYAVGIGVENGFIQEGGTAKESFIPSWNGEGV